MLRPALTITLVACTLISGWVHADVYRFTDDKGQVQYTDKPQVLPAERLRVQSQQTDMVAIKATEGAALAAKGRETTQAQQAEARQASELSAKDKAERCVKARERYDQYMNSQRLYKTLPNGERSYLSDAEMDTARNSAKSSMEEFCK